MRALTSNHATGFSIPASLRRHLKLAEEKVNALFLPALAAAPAFNRPAGDYTFDVKYYGGDQVDVDRALARAAADLEAIDAISLYFHFPLCPYVCRFCHYHVRASSGHPGENSQLLGDLHSCASVATESLQRVRTKRVSSIYLGGGTPSLLRSEELGELLGQTRAHFQCGEVEEITVEATPDSRPPDIGFCKPL